MPDKEILREGMETYLQSRGIDTRRAFTCLNPAHEDRHPSMHFDPKRNCVHCFACGQDYDIFDLVGIEFNLSRFPDQRQKVRELLGRDAGAPPQTPLKGQRPLRIPSSTGKGKLKVHTARSAEGDSQGAQPLEQGARGTASPDVSAYLARVRQRIGDTAYPAQRGLTEGTILRFGLGFDAAFTQGTPWPWQALIIPTGPGSFTARNTAAGAEKHSRVRKVGGAPLFHAEALSGKGPVFVAEGEIDALSLMEVGADAVGLGGVAGANRLLALLEERRPERGIILCLDADESGRKASLALLAGLKERGIPASVAQLPEGSKDPNDALVAGREAFRAWTLDMVALHLEQAEAEREVIREAYRRNSVRSCLQGFVDGIAESVDTPSVPTGFALLDQALDGGLYEGLYIIGAITSLGKTTFALQMADQIAAGGQDVLIFSLEMARSELIAKSISRETLRVCQREGMQMRHAKTSRGITDGRRYAGYGEETRAVIKRAIQAYHGVAGHLYVQEGIGDIGAEGVRQAVREHLEVTGKRPVVLIDYLQIMAPYDVRATDKQNIDKAVLELKRISRDYKLPVIAISSFNRENYRNAVSMVAFKESGAIEYSSDVLIGLQMKGAGEASFDAETAKKKDPREITLKVLKNRNGAVGAEVNYAYYPLFNYFSEEKGEA